MVIEHFKTMEGRVHILCSPAALRPGGRRRHYAVWWIVCRPSWGVMAEGDRGLWGKHTTTEPVDCIECLAEGEQSL